MFYLKKMFSAKHPARRAKYTKKAMILTHDHYPEPQSSRTHAIALAGFPCVWRARTSFFFFMALQLLLTNFLGRPWSQRFIPSIPPSMPWVFIAQWGQHSRSSPAIIEFCLLPLSRIARRKKTTNEYAIYRNSNHRTPVHWDVGVAS